MSNSDESKKDTDYLIIGAGAMGMAFADEIFTRDTKAKLTIVDRRAQAGGHWIDAYPFVRLHQPAAFYGVNSLVLGNGSDDLSSKTEILNYYEKIIAKFRKSGRVEFLAEHDYLGEGKVVDRHDSNNIYTYKIKERLVDATYMKVEVPSTHAPKYKVAEGVPLIPINDLVEQHDKWENFYVIGNGKTGMDAVLYLLDQGVTESRINWICPNQAWMFKRESLQVGKVGDEVLMHAEYLVSAESAEEVFLEMEKKGGIIRLDRSNKPKKWRCATINSKELEQLRCLENIISKGRVVSISKDQIELQEGQITYADKTLFVDCSANGLSKQRQTPIFSEGKITLQSVLFCQQVFSAAAIARLALMKISDKRRNKVIPVPHPERTEDWPSSIAVTIENLILINRYFPMWMFRSRLNFMSHEPMLNYFGYAFKAMRLNSGLKKAVRRINGTKT